MRKLLFILFLASSFFSKAQIAFRSAAGSNNGGGGTSIIMNMPPGVKNGDILVMSIATLGGFPNPALSSWTLLNSTINSPYTCYYWKVASSEPSSYTQNITSSKASGVIIAISGGTSIQPATANGCLATLVASSATTTITANALANSFASTNGIDLFLGDMDYGTTAAAPTNYTLAAQSASTGGGASSRTTSGISYRVLSGVTTVGSLSAVYGHAGNTNGFGYHVFIKEGNRGKFFLILNQ